MRRRERSPMVLVAVLVAPLLVAGCGGTAGGSGSALSVVASFYPLQYVAERVAGPHATVTGLTEPGQEPHDIELPIGKTAELSEADLVVYQGGFQEAVDDAVDTAGPSKALDVADVADLLTVDGGAFDPHFWLDPRRMVAVAQAVEEALAEVDPGHATDFEANLDALRDDLTELDAAYTDGLADCARTTVVVSHEAFGYVGARYGLELHAINGLSPEAEPSPAHLTELHDLVEQAGITTVFTERLASAALAESLAGDLGLTTAVLDPIEGLSDETADEDYLSLMRRNLDALRKANDCS